MNSLILTTTSRYMDVLSFSLLVFTDEDTGLELESRFRFILTQLRYISIPKAPIL